MDTWIDEDIRARDEQVIRQTLAQLPRPSAIKNIEIEFGENHSGDPAVRVWLIVPKNFSLENSNGKAAYDFCEEVSMALVGKRLRHWPYVNFRSHTST